MEDARQLWSWWQSLLAAIGSVFTRPGWVRFVQWVTGMVMCGEEHTITQILVSPALESRWRAVEHFAEYGAWDRPAVERQTVSLIEHECPARWGGYHPVALDDTKLHRTSERVWGTCTFHESAARSPNRAETVRAHNWVVMGDLLPITRSGMLRGARGAPGSMVRHARSATSKCSVSGPSVAPTNSCMLSSSRSKGTTGHGSW